MAIQQQNVKHRSYPRTMLLEKPHYYLFIKRFVDILVSCTLILLLLPLMVWISYLIYKREGKPIFHRELVVGKHEKSFVKWTFRTKTIPSKVIRSLPPHPVPENFVDGVPHQFKININGYMVMTPTGNWLMKYNLDKVPLLFHVLKGNMSLIGPEPEVLEIAKYYNDLQRKRLNVKPGITGYAQINQQSNHNHQKKIIYDLYYVNHISPLLDASILWQASKKIVARLTKCFLFFKKSHKIR